MDSSLPLRMTNNERSSEFRFVSAGAELHKSGRFPMELQEYTKMAEVEDRMWYYRALHAHVRRELAAGLRGVRAPKLLDGGCGTGGLIAYLRSRHADWRLTGVDLIPLACELSRSRCGAGVEIAQGSVTALPFADGEFDAVVSNDVISQIDEPDVALAEFRRVLRPGGVLVINLPAYMWMWSYHDDAVGTTHRYVRGEFDAMLTEAGFVERRFTYWNAILFPAIWAQRRLLASKDQSSDVKLFPAPVEAACNGVMALERAWLGMGGGWPWGLSLLSASRKPGPL
jgi:SAM-dependent methyltransferase